jgi:hypothetical protein
MTLHTDDDSIQPVAGLQLTQHLKTLGSLFSSVKTKITCTKVKPEFARVLSVIKISAACVQGGSIDIGTDWELRVLDTPDCHFDVVIWYEDLPTSVRNITGPKLWS